MYLLFSCSCAAKDKLRISINSLAVRFRLPLFISNSTLLTVASNCFSFLINRLFPSTADSFFLCLLGSFICYRHNFKVLNDSLSKSNIKPSKCRASIILRLSQCRRRRVHFIKTDHFILFSIPHLQLQAGNDSRWLKRCYLSFLQFRYGSHSFRQTVKRDL